MRPFPLVSALVLLSAVGFSLRGGGGGSDPRTPPPPVNSVFAGVLLRAGLPAETLAAAGINGEEIPELVAAVEGGYSAQTLAGLDQAFISAKAARDQLVRKVRSGLASAQEASSVAQAEAALAGASASRDAYLDGLRTAALATVSAEKATLVQTIRANRTWALDFPYLAKNRSEADWVALRDALSTKRIADREEDEELPGATASYLAAIDADPVIAAAKVDRDTLLFDVQTAWNTAAQGH